MAKYITVKGARVHNLKNIDLTIPRDKLVVFTGLSGCGKSSLAFDTIYAEGHRRFVESLSSYARMFLGQLDKPDIDSIDGLSPAISIDQKTTSRNPRSTVGTVTEIYDYLRLLYARIGVPHCPVCGKEIRQQTTEQIIEKVMTFPERSKFMILAPVVRAKKGMHEKVIESARKGGFVRARIDGNMYELSEEISLEKNLKHTIEIVVDRLIMKPDIRGRLADSIETALKIGAGNCLVVEENGNENFFSQSYACEEHDFYIGELEPRMFSFNAPLGACPHCLGIGEMKRVAFELAVPDTSLSLRNGAIQVNGFKSLDEHSWNGPLFAAVGKKYGFTLDTPIKSFSKKALEVLKYGDREDYYTVTRYFDNTSKKQTVTFDGIINMMQQRYEQNPKMYEYYEQFMIDEKCPACGGARLNPAMLGVTVCNKNIDDFCRMSVTDALEFICNLDLTQTEEKIAHDIVKEIRSRLEFLKSVGLEYLTLARNAGTLSGGEAQRIRLATQIGSALTGVLYILDEPSIGLHQRDNDKLIDTLKALRDTGNTVIVVEHDEQTMMESDYIVDIGPGAGVNGGRIVAAGTPDEIKKNPDSVTGAYLSGKKKIEIPKTRRKGNGEYLTVKGAREHNLKNIDVSFPLGEFICVTGVSGSGKSSLVNEIIYKSLARTLNRAYTFPGEHDEITGTEHLDKVIAIDQSPIGRTPRSNPATYTGLFNDIRELFAQTKEAKARGYKANRFSFNLKGGRCEACEGDGVKKIEMHFLPDVYVTCDECHGKRYNRETLECKYKDKSIFDVLDMSIDEAAEFFDALPKLKRKLDTMKAVGLGYIKVGQSSTTLSGGEAQRVKLAAELSKRGTGKTLYILDEPTTGLHSEDVSKLIEVLQRLVEGGNTVIVIEHNLDLIKTADYIIDLGPEGGDCGGEIIAAGTPEEVAKVDRSYTGQFLKKILYK